MDIKRSLRRSSSRLIELQFCTVARWKNAEIVAENLFYDQVDHPTPFAIEQCVSGHSSTV